MANRRLTINNQQITPQDLTSSALAQSGAKCYVATLQLWLQLISPDYYSGLVDGQLSDALLNGITAFKVAHDLPAQQEPIINTALWETLEGQLAAQYPPANYSDQQDLFLFDSPEEQLQSLANFGIHLQTPSEGQAGLQLLQAVLRDLAQYQPPAHKMASPPYPALVNGTPHFAKRLWRNTPRRWGLLTGAPWLGYVLLPFGESPENQIWGQRELQDILAAWGKAHIEALLHVGNSIQEAMAQPLIIRLTGSRLGGRGSWPTGFSQVGTQALLDLPPTEAALQAMASSLLQADVSWRLYLPGAGDPPGVNISYTPGQQDYMVLGQDPVLRELYRQPARVERLLRQQPAYLEDDRNLKRFAKGIAEAIDQIAAPELAYCFKTLKAHKSSLPGDLLSALNATKGLGAVIERVSSEGKGPIQDLLRVLDLSLLPDNIRQLISQYEQYLAAVYLAREHWKEYLYELGADALKREIKAYMAAKLMG